MGSCVLSFENNVKGRYGYWETYLYVLIMVNISIQEYYASTPKYTYKSEFLISMIKFYLMIIYWEPKYEYWSKIIDSLMLYIMHSLL
jgi:hypothetical protein